MAESTVRLLLWRSGAIRCGAPIQRVARVLPHPPVTAIPDAPPAVLGVSNIEGKLVTVVDCRVLLGEPAPGPGAELVLVRVGTRTVGLAVDEVKDIVVVADRALLPGRDGREWEADLGGGATATLLDLDALLAPLFPD